METLIFVLIVSCIIGCIVGLGVCSYGIYDTFRNIARLKQLQQRNLHLYDYRMKVLYRSLEEFKKLPSYDYMLNSDLPLEDEIWISDFSLN